MLSSTNISILTVWKELVLQLLIKFSTLNWAVNTLNTVRWQINIGSPTTTSNLHIHRSSTFLRLKVFLFSFLQLFSSHSPPSAAYCRLQVQKAFQPQGSCLLFSISHKCSVVKYRYEGNCMTVNVELSLETRENQSHITGRPPFEN